MGRDTSTGQFTADVLLGVDTNKFIKGMNDAANRMQSVGTSFAASAAKMVTAAATLAGGMAMHALVSGGMEYNAQMEAGRDKVAATLRLYDHLSPGVEATASAAAQFTGNLREAETVQKRLVKIADESPGSYQQVDRMFQSMLPSARAITGDMEKIMDLTTKTTLFAGITGDFDLAGSQMGMMLGGAAGQEMQMWRLLKPSFAKILEAQGKVKEGANSADITKAFNQALTPAERLEYTMQALNSLGPEVAEHFGKSWEGATSQAESRLKELSGIFTKGLYEQTKAWLVMMTSGEGALSSTGSGYKGLKEAANYAGARLDAAAAWMFGKLTLAVDYLSTNWKPIVDNMERAFSTGLNAAKMFLAAKMAQGAAGGMYNMGKAAFNAGEKLPGLVSSVVALGPAALVAAPAMLLLGAAMGGIMLVFGGVAAYFIQNWDDLLAGLASGAITIAPILDVVDLLWAKLVALGSAFIGTTNVAGGAQSVIDGVAGALTWMMGVMGDLIRAAGYVSLAVGSVVNGFNLIIIGFTTVIEGILLGIQFLLDSVNAWIGSEAISSASASITSAQQVLAEDREKRIVSATSLDTTEKLFAAAAAFDRATVEGEGITAGLRKDFEGSLAKLGQGEGGGMTKAKGANVNIHNMNVYNDMRDQDPDRIMGTFVQKLEDVTMRPTQATTLDDNGA